MKALIEIEVKADGLIYRAVQHGRKFFVTCHYISDGEPMADDLECTSAEDAIGRARALSGRLSGGR